VTDTAAKRAAALGVGLPPGVVVPLPDGEIDSQDRAALAGVYASEEVAATPARPARRFTVRFDTEGDDGELFRLGTITKDPDDDYPILIDLYELAAHRWFPNEPFDLNEYVRPSIPNGFVYRATAGTSGGREPRWPRLAGGTVLDGSVTWTAVAATTQALSVVSAVGAASDPTGITIVSPTVEESRKIRATYQGGTDGSSYDIVWTFTIDGVERAARQRINIRRS
jgi:hypothetical protein